MVNYAPIIASLNPPYPIQGITQLINQEGLETHAYTDSLGNWTIGVGHTPAIPGEVWTVQKCIEELLLDIRDKGVYPVTTQIPWAQGMGEVRFWVLVNMSFNMGIGGLMQFSETLDNMKTSNWLGALQGMQNSLWYDQVMNRAKALMYQLYFNEWVNGYLSVSQGSKLFSILP